MEVHLVSVSKTSYKEFSCLVEWFQFCIVQLLGTAFIIVFECPVNIVYFHRNLDVINLK